MKKYAIILLFFSIFTFVLAGYKTFLSLTHPIKYQDIIIENAEKFQIPASTIASIINVESSYRPNVKSNKNAIGLMQIKLSTANYLNDINDFDNISEEKLFEVKTNIDYGCAYLNYLIKKFQNFDLAIIAYNAGETRVRTWLSNDILSPDGKKLIYIPYKETREYLEKVKKNIDFYSKVYKDL